jgi:hypothetical protein
VSLTPVSAESPTHPQTVTEQENSPQERKSNTKEKEDQLLYTLW